MSKDEMNAIKEDVHENGCVTTLRKVHEEHPSHGYRWVHDFIQTNYTVECSASFIYKIFRYLGIK